MTDLEVEVAADLASKVDKCMASCILKDSSSAVEVAGALPASLSAIANRLSSAEVCCLLADDDPDPT